MGVDSNLLINSKYNVKDVVKLITALGAKNIEEEHKGDHSFIRFDLDGSYRRQLYVAQSSEYGGLSGTILSYRSNEEGIQFLKKIAKVVGGFLQESDCGDEWQAFYAPHGGNSEFILKHQILSNAIDKSDELADKIAAATGYR